MDFLLVSDDKHFKDETKKRFLLLDSENYIEQTTFNKTSIKKTKATLENTSLCIIFSKDSQYHPVDEISVLSNLLGYLVASHVPVLTNNTFIKDHSLFSDGQILCFENAEKIYTYIESNYPELKLKDRQTKAKKALFNTGIPYTTDCFATFVSKNKIELCKLFIEAGMDYNSTDDSGTSMLNIAVRNDNFEIVQFLVDLGANINVTSADRGYTPLMDAVWRGNRKIAAYLITKGADLNTISKEGQSNLILSVGADRAPLCKLLVENGADPDITDGLGMSAWGYATLFKKTEIMEILKPYHKEN